MKKWIALLSLVSVSAFAQNVSVKDLNASEETTIQIKNDEFGPCRFFSKSTSRLEQCPALVYCHDISPVGRHRKSRGGRNKGVGLMFR